MTRNYHSQMFARPDTFSEPQTIKRSDPHRSDNIHSCRYVNHSEAKRYSYFPYCMYIYQTQAKITVINTDAVKSWCAKEGELIADDKKQLPNNYFVMLVRHVVQVCAVKQTNFMTPRTARASINISRLAR